METKVMVLLNEVKKVQKFINEVSKFNSDVDLVKGRYVIDAKSIMGIFGLDLSNPVQVKIHSVDDKEIVKFNEIMKEFVC